MTENSNGEDIGGAIVGALIGMALAAIVFCAVLAYKILVHSAKGTHRYAVLFGEHRDAHADAVRAMRTALENHDRSLIARDGEEQAHASGILLALPRHASGPKQLLRLSHGS